MALFFRSRAALVPGLVAIALSSAMAWPVYHYGEKSYDRVYPMLDQQGDAWLNTHMHRAEKLINVFYALALLAVLAIVLPIKWPRSSLPLAGATLLLALVTLSLGGWIAYAGGRSGIRSFAAQTSPRRIARPKKPT